jgi:hypothetical protein
MVKHTLVFKTSMLALGGGQLPAVQILDKAPTSALA